MKNTKRNQLLRHLTLCLFCLCLQPMMAHAEVAKAALPSNSIYQFSPQLTIQDGTQINLADLRGKHVIISMFYSSCQFVCPMLIDAIHNTQQQLTPEQREKFTVLLVSFDPERDTLARLNTIAQEHRLDLKHWMLLRTDASNVRKLAALLGIQYRRLPSGDYNHTTDIILLDTQGRIAGRTAKLSEIDNDFLTLLRHAAAE